MLRLAGRGQGKREKDDDTQRKGGSGITAWSCGLRQPAVSWPRKAQAKGVLL